MDESTKTRDRQKDTIQLTDEELENLKDPDHELEEVVIRDGNKEITMELEDDE